jgi:hypothetical protein
MLTAEPFSVGKLRKYVLLTLLFLSLPAYGQLLNFKLGEARGLFLGMGVGPRIAVGDLSINHSMASGVEVILSYTDNRRIPFFVYSKAQFINFPSEFKDVLSGTVFELSSKVLSLQPGVRYFLPPISTQVVLLMPFVEGGMNLGVMLNKYQYNGAFKSQYYDSSLHFGFHAGVGVSVFLMDALISYNYYYSYQFLGFTLRVRIPIFMKI